MVGHCGEPNAKSSDEVNGKYDSNASSLAMSALLPPEDSRPSRSTDVLMSVSERLSPAVLQMELRSLPSCAEEKAGRVPAPFPDGLPVQR
jgi:hypothetical protein